MVETREKYSVLIVDDDREILDLLSISLSDLPYEILNAATSADAIRYIEHGNIAVLLCDLHMADDMDGNAILARARKVNSDTVSILMSGQMERDAMIKALNEGGVTRYLEKPLDLNEVRRLVEEGITRYVRRSRPQERLTVLARKVTTRMSRDTGQPVIGGLPFAPVRKPEPPPVTARVIGDRYRLLAVLGEGSIGTVYRAQDMFLHMIVALKMLSPHLTTNDRIIAELKEEARIAMTLSHRNIVRLYNFDHREDNYFLVMEYVEGCTLRDILLEDGRLPWSSVLAVAQTCGSALSYAHEHGVVHQDLKPENLLVSANGMLKIIDFGLACLIGRQQDRNEIAGTPAYMSPEQKQGRNVDARTDIYSLGLVLYELLTGRVPFATNLTTEQALAVHPEPLKDLPPAVLEVLEKAIARDPENRWESVGTFTRTFADVCRAAHLSDHE